MYDRSAASASSNSVPAKQLPGSIEREEAARRQIHALQRALDEMHDLAHEPVVRVREQRLGRRRGRSPASPSVFTTTVPISGSLSRSRSSASSSSRNARSGQN